MKRIVIWIALVIVGFAAQSQETTQEVDSAEVVLERYLALLNYDAIRTDSILYIESRIFSLKNPIDTIVMKRWFYPEANYRVELWQGGKLAIGLHSNGYDTFMQYEAEHRKWFKVDVVKYYNRLDPYNFHGPFFHWKDHPISLRYDGVWNFNGNQAYRLFIKQQDQFDRYYMFEKESGLLFMYDELDSYMEMERDVTSHADWRAFHEYTPLGKCLFPSIESYQMEGDIIMIYHQYRYIKFDYDIFLED